MIRGTNAHGEPAPSEFVQAARRVDWRFLLPESELGRVACAAGIDRRLVTSLRLFSASVAGFDAAAATTESHDVLVLANPSRRELAAAAGVLRPGGWVYVELRGGAARAALRRFRSPGAVANALARSGFGDVRAYWHFPDAERREGLVALDDDAAVRHVLTRRPRTVRAAAREHVARLLLAVGLFAFVVSSTSVIGRRNDEGDAGRA